MERNAGKNHCDPEEEERERSCLATAWFPQGYTSYICLPWDSPVSFRCIPISLDEPSLQHLSLHSSACHLHWGKWRAWLSQLYSFRIFWLLSHTQWYKHKLLVTGLLRFLGIGSSTNLAVELGHSKVTVTKNLSGNQENENPGERSSLHLVAFQVVESRCLGASTPGTLCQESVL